MTQNFKTIVAPLMNIWSKVIALLYRHYRYCRYIAFSGLIRQPFHVLVNCKKAFRNFSKIPRAKISEKCSQKFVPLHFVLYVTPIQKKQRIIGILEPFSDFDTTETDILKYTEPSFHSCVQDKQKQHVYPRCNRRNKYLQDIYKYIKILVSSLMIL